MYIRTLIPGLFFYAWNMCVQAYMQSQRITRPSAVGGVVAAVLHVPVNLVLIRTCGLGYVGAGLATSWSNGVVLAINVGWLCFDKSHIARGGSPAWEGWSLAAATSEWGPFLRLALPGILMMAEWWASEANILIAGLLPDPEKNVAGVSIFQARGLLTTGWNPDRITSCLQGECSYICADSVRGERSDPRPSYEHLPSPSQTARS